MNDKKKRILLVDDEQDITFALSTGLEDKGFAVDAFAPIKFEIADDLSYWSDEIPGKVVAKAEALTGPMTPPGKRVQTINPPGSEVGPGAVATRAKSTADQADAMGFKWERKGQSSKHIPFEWSGP
jgi:hypothetical protein